MDRKTKIIATIGPSLMSQKKIDKIIDQGANVLRINFSHGTLEDHENVINWIKSSNKKVAIMQDIQGPKIRTGDSEANTVLEKSKSVKIVNGNLISNSETICIKYEDLFKDINIDDRVLIDDGSIVLKVQNKTDDSLEALTLVGGELRDNQGVAFPDSNLSVSAITPKDIEHLKFGSKHDVDYVAVSFVRNADDIKSVKKLIPSDIKVIAKIELKSALENIDDILSEADGVMVARGDLGVQLPLEEVPFIQKQILDATNSLGKISITATEMLQSMKTSYRPTRAEVTDITNAILEGSDAVMLSAETSIGNHPERVVEVMSSICRETDSRNDTSVLKVKAISNTDLITTSLASSAVRVANEIDAKAIVAFTESGRTPLLISNYRPRSPILTFTTKEKTYKQMNLLWGVDQFMMERKETFEEMLQEADSILSKSLNYNTGDKIVVVAGTPPNVEAATNMIRVHRVGEI
jgi:pyruvate kinase